MFVMKRLPKVNKGFGDKKETVREYIQKKRDANKIPKELDGYLCEREVYTPANYDIIREKFSDFLVDNTDFITSACTAHNKDAFMSYFDAAMGLTNDWTSARMLIHCSIQEFSLVGGMVSLFEWADDLMVHSLHSSSATNR